MGNKAGIEDSRGEDDGVEGIDRQLEDPDVVDREQHGCSGRGEVGAYKQ